MPGCGADIGDIYKQPTFSKTWGLRRSAAEALHLCLNWVWAKHQLVAGEAKPEDLATDIRSLSAFLNSVYTATRAAPVVPEPAPCDPPDAD